MIAEESYNVETARKEGDEGYECESIFGVTPFTSSDSGGKTIAYYWCQTAYATDEPKDYTGLSMAAIDLVIAIDMAENGKECKVIEFDAFLCEIDDRTYLCWTLSSEISCVIEYNADTESESDIFLMAESIPLPAE